jgi:hypothetical protein
MGKFQNSVWLLKRKQFREYAKQNHEWVDPDSERQFDEAVNDLKRKRDFQYVDKIKERYGDEWLYKVIDWGRSNLSQLEMDSFKNFEEMSAEYVMQNKDSLSADEIGKFLIRSPANSRL